MIQDLIASALIVESLQATDKDDVLDEMLQHSIDAERIPSSMKTSLRKKLREREANGSTGIGNGVAVPHVKSKKVEGIVLILGRSASGVPYQAVDGRDVHSIFMVFANEDAAAEHLDVLRWISTLARNADFRRFLTGSDTPEAIRDLLLEMTPS